jgi:hypothetical protein
MKKKTYLIIIPYLPEAAQGRELEYAIEGWRRHFKENFVIAVVGERLPKIEGDDVVCIESPRVPDTPGQYRQHLDYVSCFRKVHKALPQFKDGFIFVADDCYAVNDFDIHDIMFLKMKAPDFDYDPYSANHWRRDKMKTKAVLQAAGLPTRDFTTHIPHWFEWRKWEALVEKYDMAHSSLVIEDLYYNTYYPDRVPFQLSREHDNLKLGAYSGHPDTAELDAAFHTKIWITNNPDGFVRELDQRLRNYYGI